MTRLVTSARAAWAVVACVAAAGFLAAPCGGQGSWQPAAGPASQPASSPASGPAGIVYTDVRVDIDNLPERWYVRRPSAKVTPLPRPVKQAFTIPIREEIRDSTYDALVRKMGEAKARGADMIVFDMDTPGGSSQAMNEIAKLIMGEEDVHTVAYVNPQAFSAGAVIALACDEIVMTSNGVIGDAMPILLGPGGVQAMDEELRGKIESAATAIIRTLAERNGYNKALCEAMITLKMEVWLVRKRDTGELAIVSAGEVRHLVAGAPADEEARVASRPASGPVYDYLLTIDTDKELVTMTASEAYKMGFTDHILDSIDELRAHYGIDSPLQVLEDTWSEKLASFLASPAVTGILMFVGIIAVYAELHTPGFGLAGITAIICFALLLGSRYLTGLAQWWEVALFFLGLVMIAIEVFLIPGFGVVGITGIICCVAALLAMVVPNAPDKLPLPDTDLDWSIFSSGAMALGIAFVCALAGMAGLARVLPKVPVAGRLILAPPRTTEAPPAAESAPIQRVNVGDVGIVTAACRPVGVVRFGEMLVAAVSEGELIPIGEKVRVLANEGNRIVVTAVS